MRYRGLWIEWTVYWHCLGWLWRGDDQYVCIVPCYEVNTAGSLVCSLLVDFCMHKVLPLPLLLHRLLNSIVDWQGCLALPIVPRPWLASISPSGWRLSWTRIRRRSFVALVQHWFWELQHETTWLKVHIFRYALKYLFCPIWVLVFRYKEGQPFFS
jgi:hypothetical protein